LRLLAYAIYEESKDLRYYPPQLLRRKVKAGELGRKTGRVGTSMISRETRKRSSHEKYDNNQVPSTNNQIIINYSNCRNIQNLITHSAKKMEEATQGHEDIKEDDDVSMFRIVMVENIKEGRPFHP
jgi:3-hydroxyacyl-CoA dehydrogenase